MERVISLLAAIALLLAGCGGGSSRTPAKPATPSAASELSRIAQLGEKLFHDPSLSASGRVACASCHVAERALAGDDAGPTPLGGPGVDQPGPRNTPSIRYLGRNPAFGFDSDGTAIGGFDRDGRAASLADQARGPMLSPIEMANASPADIAAKLQRTSYAAEFRAIFGDRIFDDPDAALDRAVQAIARYEQEDPDFAPFTSKYDAFLAGRVSLTPQELRGLALFNDPTKGNCAACHPSARGADGSPPVFTDFSYDNLGVPRNAAIPANTDPTYFDLGLCGPSRTDLAKRRDLCGAFKVPTLRNVALTAPYFHNGHFATLRDVVSFYVRRDTHPEEWYSLGADGTVRKFDDLPPDLASNVNTTEVPYNRRPGDLPALNAGEIDDVVAFLQTLTDGYRP
jgi:cytochrome c peroxidase